MDHHTYRWFYTSQKSIVVGGKNAEQNDQLLKEILRGGGDYVVMHTATPGSPFTIILKPRERVKAHEIEECAVFTGCFSQEWKKRKATASVHIFTTMQLEKKKDLKTGTWSVSGSVKKVKVPLRLALTVQEETLRAVPIQTVRKPLALVCPGLKDKTLMIDTLKEALNDTFSESQILAALPAGGVQLCYK